MGRAVAGIDICLTDLDKDGALQIHDIEFTPSS
jgi:hypothetical protein